MWCAGTAPFIIPHNRHVKMRIKCVCILHTIYHTERSMFFCASCGLLKDLKKLIKPPLRHPPKFILLFVDDFLNNIWLCFKLNQKWLKWICREGQESWQSFLSWYLRAGFFTINQYSGRIFHSVPTPIIHSSRPLFFFFFYLFRDVYISKSKSDGNYFL